MTAPVVLTLDEAVCMAQRLVARHLADHGGELWADWEMVPELTSASYELLVEQLDVVAARAKRSADNLDASLGVDSRELLERAS
jgi:hypothetical protein